MCEEGNYHDAHDNPFAQENIQVAVVYGKAVWGNPIEPILKVEILAKRFQPVLFVNKRRY